MTSLRYKRQLWRIRRVISQGRSSPRAWPWAMAHARVAGPVRRLRQWITGNNIVLSDTCLRNNATCTYIPTSITEAVHTETMRVSMQYFPCGCDNSAHPTVSRCCLSMNVVCMLVSCHRITSVKCQGSSQRSWKGRVNISTGTQASPVCLARTNDAINCVYTNRSVLPFACSGWIKISSAG